MPLIVGPQERMYGTVIVTAAGSLDTSTAPILEKEIKSILEKSPPMIILDLKGLDYISSMGVRVIFQTHKSLSLNDGKLMMVNLQPKVKKVFDIINALPKMGIFQSIEEMDAYLDAIQKGIKK
ncbi:MAG: STAS domain-containing protein [candidate division NC10 bacterium]